MSRAKGVRSEREVELILQAAGLHTDRNLGGRAQVSGDIAARVEGDSVWICDECGSNTYGPTRPIRGCLGRPSCPFVEYRRTPVPPPLAIEVRRRETLSLSRWSAEHEASTPDHQLPAVVYRRSREPWRISMPLDRFLELLTGEASK